MPVTVRGKAEKEKEKLNEILGSLLATINDTIQVLDQKPHSSLPKVCWEDVIKMGDQVSKQATIVGMLWSGEKPESKAIEENMETYFNTLQGFLLLSHGSKVGAGPTLSSSVDASLKQVVDSSFRLMKGTVSFYGSHGEDLKLSLPQLVGAVWEACSALKKTPITNITAIGRGMTQVAVSVKDVLREMRELKLASSDDPSEDDLGNDLSPEEMKVAQCAIVVVSDSLLVIKELIRSITGLLKQEKPNDNSTFVNSLEKLLQQCQEIGRQIDEIGFCLYPPQGLSSIKAALEKIQSTIDAVEVELGELHGTPDLFQEACSSLRSSLKQLASEVEVGGSSAADIEAKLENITLTK
ncbi:uncharacterized protein LOC113873192 [Abrus precatorius]|uniref:Uncharacterized protein LOC113873192 n=1 Tax=Abrus precatorius TaxID=3816 RepID=A0A8B8MIG1_ABRPR|nr:uncharacterized protein LOC113873192 [Abrus precatorius]